MTTVDNDLFRAEARKGFVIKSTFDILAQRLIWAKMSFTKKGIMMRIDDTDNTVLFDMSYPRDYFASYRCERDFSVSIPVSQVQKLLRNVKKKDGIVIRISNNDHRKLHFEIKSETSRSVPRRERINVDIVVGEIGTVVDLPDGGYNYPMVIESSEYQKIKKFSSVNVRIISLRMQSNNFIEFRGQSEKIFSDSLEYGAIIDNPEDVDDDEDNFNTGDDDIPGLYQEEFAMAAFSMLIKAAALGQTMAFYRPKRKGFPLLVKLKPGEFAYFDIYLKDKAQIEFEKMVKEKKTKTK